MMAKKKIKQEAAEVHEKLKGFEIGIDQFGQMQLNYKVDELNAFLDEAKSEEE